MDKYAMLKKVGSMQQVAHVRPITFMEGRAGGLKGYDVKNGNLRFQVISDKCLDISECSYKGMNLSFMAKQGLVGRMDYDTHGNEGAKSIMGGLLFTCGLENTCLPCTVDGIYYPMHGRIRSAPAEHVSADANWKDEGYKIKISGEMREAELFGNNMTLRRTIETLYGEKTIKITDEIENLSYCSQPMMILYHFNLGYPLLDEDARIILPTKEVRPRDEAARNEADMWNFMAPPIEHEPERVYLHELAADADGNTFACLVNEKIQIGVKIAFNKKYLPHFIQWKSLGAGDYAMGLEPTNSNVYGLSYEKDKVHTIQPFQKEVIELEITIMDGKEEIDKVKQKVDVLLKG